MHQRRGGGGGGAVCPDGIDRIARHRDQLGLLVRQRLRRCRNPLLAVQPGIVADLRARCGMLAEPFGDAGLRHALIAIEPTIDLIAHLQRIASIDEHRGPRIQTGVGQHHRRPRRTAEAGQPGETLGIAADIFAHMLVGDRHDEAVEAARLQFLAQRIEPGLMGVHQHGCSPLPANIDALDDSYHSPRFGPSRREKAAQRHPPRHRRRRRLRLAARSRLSGGDRP